MNIDHLVLHDTGAGGNGAANPVNGPAFARRTEAALHRLLSRRGLPEGFAGSADARDLSLPEITLPAHATDARAADELAEALYRALLTAAEPRRG